MAEKKRMTAKDWIKAEAMFESGDFTLNAIGERFGVPPITVQRYMIKHGITKGARAEEIQTKVEEKLDKAVEEKADVFSRRIQETKESHNIFNAAIVKRFKSVLHPSVLRPSTVTRPWT